MIYNNTFMGRCADNVSDLSSQLSYDLERDFSEAGLGRNGDAVEKCNDGVRDHIRIDSDVVKSEPGIGASVSNSA